MNWQQVINEIMQIPEVDDVVLVSKVGAIKVHDGRWLLPVNIYLKELPAEGGTLGVVASEQIGVKDEFGGG